MSGKSGLDFINDHKKDLDTPIILLTAKGEASERVEGLELGADDYLAKPFEPKELILRIKNILTNYLFILFISCILEIFHLIVPNRAFELYDLIANFTGVVIILLLNSFIKWRKHL